jgi:hypothetical protein
MERWRPLEAAQGSIVVYAEYEAFAILPCAFGMMVISDLEPTSLIIVSAT